MGISPRTTTPKPMVTWRVDGTSSADVDAERSRRRESMFVCHTAQQVTEGEHS